MYTLPKNPYASFTFGHVTKGWISLSAKDNLCDVVRVLRGLRGQLMWCCSGAEGAEGTCDVVQVLR